MHVIARAICAALAFVCVFSHPAAAQPEGNRVPRFDSASRTRGLAWGWGHSWSPFFGKTRSHIGFVAFHPQMGWFLTDRLELYGEATLFVYHQPLGHVSAGLGGLAGRWHFWNDRALTPYIVAGVGLLWTSLDVREIDRDINGQHFGGIGLRWAPLRGPGLTIELRNHHISNAGTAGENLGVNAGTIVAGVQWILR
jgi:lipid A 3-O-deacylase